MSHRSKPGFLGDLNGSFRSESATWTFHSFKLPGEGKGEVRSLLGWDSIPLAPETTSLEAAGGCQSFSTSDNEWLDPIGVSFWEGGFIPQWMLSVLPDCVLGQDQGHHPSGARSAGCGWLPAKPLQELSLAWDCFLSLPVHAGPGLGKGKWGAGLLSWM